MGSASGFQVLRQPGGNTGAAVAAYGYTVAAAYYQGAPELIAQLSLARPCRRRGSLSISEPIAIDITIPQRLLATCPMK
jgi:hypothetical protein